MEKSQGCWTWDEHGNKYLDMTSGIGVVNIGHSHPRVVEAIQEQATRLIHSQVNLSFHRPMITLVEKLLKVMPDRSLDTFLFVNSGAEAVESALKLARYSTKKQNIIVFQGGFHGRTIGTMAMTTAKTIYRQKFGPLMPGVFVTPYPFRAQLPKNIGSDDDMAEYCLDALKHLLQQQTNPDDTAALFAETVLGEGGYVYPPEGFLKEVADLCRKHGILYVADEVQAGFGRTGKMFAVEHYDVVPDILISAKGLASGCPLSMIVSRKELMDRLDPGVMGGTYSGNVLACAAACATLDVFENEKVLDNCNARGEQLRCGLEHMIQKRLPIRGVRGRGLMIGVDLDDSVTQKDVVKECFNQNMLILPTSIFNAIRLIPPLTITKEEVDQCLFKFEKALTAAKKQ